MTFLIMLTMLPILEPKSGTPMDVKKTPLKLQFNKAQCKRFAAAAGAALGRENDSRESPNKKETSHDKNQNFVGKRTCKGDNASYIADSSILVWKFKR